LYLCSATGLINKQEAARLMNTPQNTTTTDLHLYIFRLLFQVLRPVRNKYNLSVNCLLVLNSCYLYVKLVKDQFYMTSIYKFNGYYSIPKMQNYFRVLTLAGCIVPINPDCSRVLYKLTDKGIEVIQSIDQYYNSELYDFCNRYNIDL
jgi:predicted transcriptional regulator